MNFKEAVKYMESFINYEKKKPIKYDENNYNLKNFKKLLNKFGDPHLDLNIIHVAGSKGKGSTVEFAKNILTEHGFKVGSYTSPHLVDFRERIRINDNKIPKSKFVKYVTILKDKLKDLDLDIRYRTYFELITLISFLYFRDEKVDYAVYEVGLGGRLDSTNVVDPLISIITLIDYEHMNLLGESLKEIAFEKAGIIKENKPVVISKQKNSDIIDYIKHIADKRNSKAFVYAKDFEYKNKSFCYEGDKINLKMNMIGSHQKINALTAIAAIKNILINFNKEKAYRAISNTTLKGRIEKRVYNKKILILDTGHTIESIKALFNTLEENYDLSKIYSICSFSSGKQIKKMLNIEKKFINNIYLTENSSFRTAKKNELKKFCKGCTVFDNFEKAFNHVDNITSKNDIILIHGSFYLINDVEDYLNKDE